MLLLDCLPEESEEKMRYQMEGETKQYFYGIHSSKQKAMHAGNGISGLLRA